MLHQAYTDFGIDSHKTCRIFTLSYRNSTPLLFFESVSAYNQEYSLCNL